MVRRYLRWLVTDKPAGAVEAAQTFGRLTVNHTYSTGEVPAFARDTEWVERLEDVLTEFFGLESPLVAQITAIEICREEMQATLHFENGRAVFDGQAQEHQEIWDSGANAGTLTIRKLALSSLLNLAIPLNRHRFGTETPNDKPGGQGG